MATTTFDFVLPSNRCRDCCYTFDKRTSLHAIRVSARSEISIAVERVRRSRVKAFGTIGLIFKRRFLQGLKRTFDRDAEKGVDGEVRFYYGNLARNTAHTREQIRVGIRGTMHVARARHVINIRHRNFRLNSVNRRVFFSVIRDYYSCYLKLRVEQ